MTKHVARQYAIEVPDRGYISDRIPRRVLVPEPDDSCVFSNLERATSTCAAVKDWYENFGVPEIASTVRIASRKITTTYGKWEPLQ